MTRPTVALFRKFLETGDPEAFKGAADRISPDLEAWLASDIRNPHDRDDVLNQTLLALSRAKNIDPEAIRAVAFTIARRLRIDLGRKRAVRREVPLPDVTPQNGWPAPIRAPGPTPAEQAALADDLEQFLPRLRAALLDLPEGQLDAVYLRIIRGISYRESAGVLGISVEAVRDRLHEGVKKLRAKLGNEFDE